MKESFINRIPLLAVLCLLIPALPLNAQELTSPVPPSLAKLHTLIQDLNAIAEVQINDKAGPAVPVLADIRLEDGPNFANLKTLVARADVRKSLNPGAKGALAALVSPRWDGFNLAGNLWLAALKSSNADIRARARKQLVNFIQPAHIPVLIHTLEEPGPNVLAYEVLREVTGQSLEPTSKVWTAWWDKSKNQVDLVGNLLARSKTQLLETPVKGFDQNAFWYLPEAISRANKPYDQRSISEQNAVGRWRDGARADVGRYLEQWEVATPLFEQIVHQSDPRVTEFLMSLLGDPGYGDYVSRVLAWREDPTLWTALQTAYIRSPTPGRALARGSMGDKTALDHLMILMETYKAPLTYGIMDDQIRSYVAKLSAYGVIPAEEAFEQLTQRSIGLPSAATRGEKKKQLKKAQKWLQQNINTLTFDKKHGYFVLPPEK